MQETDLDIKQIFFEIKTSQFKSMSINILSIYSNILYFMIQNIHIH